MPDVLDRKEACRLANPYLDEFLKVMKPVPPGEVQFERWVERPEYDILCQPNPMSPDWRSSHNVRRELVKRYAWAVPDDTALQAIVDLDRPVVEIGAGGGYWASLLQVRGLKIAPFDITGRSHFPTRYFDGTPFTDVLPGDHRVLEEMPRLWGCGPEHALLLCWPPYDDPMALDCLQAFKGDTLIYVGEGGGCCASHAFFDMVEDEWREVRTVDIPQWVYSRDYLTIYRRADTDG